MITAKDGSVIHPNCKDGMSLLVGIYKSFVLNRAGSEEATIKGYGESMDFLYVLFILFFRQPPLYLLIFTKNYLVVLVFTTNYLYCNRIFSQPSRPTIRGWLQIDETTCIVFRRMSVFLDLIFVGSNN